MVGLENPIHIALILIVVLLVFGAKRLPEMGRSLGEGLRGFKDSMSGEGGFNAASPQLTAASAPDRVPAAESDRTSAAA
jgi:sec-independent protein translocase protein TatA